jgi:cytochrome c
MRSRLAAVVLLALNVSFCSLAAAGDAGSKDEAVNMVKKAVAFLKANGNDKTLAAVSDPQGPFVDRDLCVVVYDMNAKCLAHGANAKMIGRDLSYMKDVDGKAYMKERTELMGKSATAWQNYKFRNPVTKKIEPKTMYLERVGDLIVGCGVYSN